MQAYIGAKQEEADAIVCTNPGVLEEYRRREARIAELTEQQAAAADKLDLVRQIIAQKKVSSIHLQCLYSVCQGPGLGTIMRPHGMAAGKERNTFGHVALSPAGYPLSLP